MKTAKHKREHAVWFPLFIQSSETGKNTYGDRSQNSGYLCQELMTGRECEKGFWVLIMLIWVMVIWGIFICENSLNYIFKICYFIIYHALFYQKCFSLIVTLIACICVHCCWFYKTVYTLHSFWKAIWQYLAGAIQMSIFLSNNYIPVIF